MGGKTPNIFMKFITKIDLILDDETLMLSSKEVANKIQKFTTKRGKAPTAKEEWRIIDGQIKKKLKNPKKFEGICACDDNYLCTHRKRYIRKAVNGR